jgi:hypothetical protein
VSSEEPSSIALVSEGRSRGGPPLAESPRTTGRGCYAPLG